MKRFIAFVVFAAVVSSETIWADAAKNDRVPGRVIVIGSVLHPGYISLKPGKLLTIAKAVNLRGGFTRFADRAHVKLAHYLKDGSWQITKVVDLTHISLSKFSNAPLLHEGDIIFVPSREIMF